VIGTNDVCCGHRFGFQRRRMMEWITFVTWIGNSGEGKTGYS